ncbi:MAG: N-6 DNA methylase, partial [Bacilli bacterium]|nr:N-6 DNA methylase [Bacilli bacterium]
MNTDTKRHIDSARQVLVGVVPNPTSQIEQITNALIYKFMDDMDQAAIKQGDEPSFFVGELESYAWTRLMDARIGNQERMNLYAEALAKFSEAKQLPELFRGIFKSAFLPYRSPETLGLFLKEINYFDYSHPEELGNAYEYLLSIMSSQGDAGQFRTPRHIIDFMVEVIHPTKDDKVLDPACGTAGFLISSYKHILQQHDRKDDPNHTEKPLNPDERKKLMTNFEGYDIDPTMVRIAQVNMYLHQFKNPKIFQYDSLSSDERWNDKFDVILANPPFMSPKGGIKPHSKFSIPSSRSEVLFTDYIMNHLRPKGRAAIIVPEGIIFQSGSAHKQLRKNLVNDGLYAVVSLPSGVFNPYAGVKTSILLFNNELAKQKSEILFVKVENDGFDLGATKRPISKNDLPTALQILHQWKTGEKVENKLAVYVTRTNIAENGDYNLSGDRYRITTDYSNAKWPMVAIEELCELGRGRVISKKDIELNPGPFPVFS